MKRIAVALSVLTVLVLAAPAGAELCEKCKGRMSTTDDLGKCVVCGGPTSSGAHKLCRKCSAKLGQCEHCRGPLKGAKPVPKPPLKPIKIDTSKPGTHTSGKWKYEYTPHFQRASITRVYSGWLTYDGKPVAENIKEWDRIKTPWGMMVYRVESIITVRPKRVFRGWRVVEPVGRLLPSPEKATPSHLRALGLDDSANVKAKAPVLKFGKAFNRLHIALTTDRTTLCPGEVLHVRGHFRNAGESKLTLPHEQNFWPMGELYVVRPNGDMFTFGLLNKRKWSQDRFQDILPEQILALRDMRLRLTNDLKYWRPKLHFSSKPLSFREEGTYRIWFEYTVPAPKHPSKRLWSGKVKSETATFTIRKMPPEKRHQTPTAQQLADLAAYLGIGQRGGGKRDEAHARLQEAIVRTENEGLAVVMVRVVGDGTYQGKDVKTHLRSGLLDMLRRRACGRIVGGFGVTARRVIPGIDGPYLKALAYMYLDLSEEKQRPETGDWLRRGLGFGSYVLPAYLKLHSEDKRAYKRAVAAMKGNWGFLLDVGALHQGMTVKEAVKFLGEPAMIGRGWMDWGVRTPRHVNPYLRAIVKDGKITEFRIVLK